MVCVEKVGKEGRKLECSAWEFEGNWCIECASLMCTCVLCEEGIRVDHTSTCASYTVGVFLQNVCWQVVHLYNYHLGQKLSPA